MCKSTIDYIAVNYRWRPNQERVSKFFIEEKKKSKVQKNLYKEETPDVWVI